MIKQSYNVIGVMSGTSLDGTDLVHVNFTFEDGKIEYKILETDTIPYIDDWVSRLKAAVDFKENELAQLDKEYTILLSGIIVDFIDRHSLTGIDGICSHGHTILHQPINKLTLQIGNLPQLAQLCGHRIVCNFRVQDVAMGGQGAPLVPIGDRLLFAGYEFCLNLGGFSNISFEKDGKRLAYDICAVNTVLNYYAGILGFDYDDKGSIAASGNINKALLNDLNGLEFYRLPHPKSLGFEFVKAIIIPLIESYDIAVEDKLATYTKHIAMQIAMAIGQEVGTKTMLITGGGAYNTQLIMNLKEMLPSFNIVVPDDKTIQFKEALIFALLGVLKLRGEINVLSSVTGAPQDHCAGYVYDAK